MLFKPPVKSSYINISQQDSPAENDVELESLIRESRSYVSYVSSETSPVAQHENQNTKSCSCGTKSRRFCLYLFTFISLLFFFCIDFDFLNLPKVTSLPEGRFISRENTKIGVLSLHIGGFFDQFPNVKNCAKDNKAAYSKLYGLEYYDEEKFNIEKIKGQNGFIANREWMVANKQPRFFKLRFLEYVIRKNLNKPLAERVDWFLWTDGDTVFSNEKTSIHDRLNMLIGKYASYDQQRTLFDRVWYGFKSIFVSQSTNYKQPLMIFAENRNQYYYPWKKHADWNNGVFFIRADDTGYGLLMDAYNTYVSPKSGWADQLSFYNFFMKDHKALQSVLLLPTREKHLIQEYDPHKNAKGYTDCCGQFIAHMPGMRGYTREKAFAYTGLCTQYNLPVPDKELDYDSRYNFNRTVIRPREYKFRP